MERTLKPLSELNLMDDFLFTLVAENREVAEPFCKTVLSVLLQRKIGKLRIIAQRTISAEEPGMRGIRMDVEIEEFAEDNDRPACVYDIEPHIKNDIHLAKHNRFYQAKLDSRYMRSGEKDFAVMPEQFVISITNYDPFGYDYMMYTMENHCKEVPELVYDDGLKFVYFYTKGTKGGSEEIKAMLNYFRDSTVENVTDKATQTLHECVGRVKDSRKVQAQYMTFGDLMDYAKEDGKVEARVEAVLELLEELGPIPEELRSRIVSETNTDTLKVWHKAAAKSDSIEDWKVRVAWEDKLPE